MSALKLQDARALSGLTHTSLYVSSCTIEVTTLTFHGEMRSGVVEGE